ncbi:hypothetical protein BH09GEM1_BH09GEM1_12250 [soil metagenome]
MSLAAVSRASCSAVELGSAGENSPLQGDASATPFAAMLAGAMDARPTVARVSVKNEVTSELDADSSNELSGAEIDHTISSTMEEIATRLGGAVTALDPALLLKLTRVVQRMRDEYGRTVTVAEGVRSQTRQDKLYAQGRTTTGPIVTWTRSSLHETGQAADLLVNGGYADTKGFDLLRQVAEEEGLHTLGAIDPGHVELRGGRGVHASAPGTLASNQAPAPGNGASFAGLARVNPGGLLASVAHVASVAARAPVASVASVARAASVAPPARVATVGSVSHAVAGAVVGSAPAPSSDKAGSSQTNGERESQMKHSAPVSPAPLRSGDGSAGERTYAALGSAAVAPTAVRMTTDAVQSASTSAARVDRVLGLQDGKGARTLSRLSLALDDGNGGQDVVRIGVRGTSVGASFDMRDSAGVDRVTSRLGELTRALERRGLEPQGFQVRATETAKPLASESVRVSGMPQAMGHEAPSTHDHTQNGARGDSRQQGAGQDDSQERSRDRSNDRRRRDIAFSLTNEES